MSFQLHGWKILVSCVQLATGSKGVALNVEAVTFTEIFSGPM